MTYLYKAIKLKNSTRLLIGLFGLSLLLQNPVFAALSGKGEIISNESSSSARFASYPAPLRPRSVLLPPLSYHNILKFSIDKERYFKGLIFRAKTYFKKRMYTECLETLNAIFIYEPYHVEAQELRRKLESVSFGKKAPKKYQEMLWTEKDEAITAKNKKKMLRVIKKRRRENNKKLKALYENNQYEDVMKYAEVLLEVDPGNKVAKSYLQKSLYMIDFGKRFYTEEEGVIRAEDLKEKAKEHGKAIQRRVIEKELAEREERLVRVHEMRRAASQFDPEIRKGAMRNLMEKTFNGTTSRVQVSRPSHSEEISEEELLRPEQFTIVEKPSPLYDVSDLLRAAKKLHRKGEYERAIMKYEEVFMLDPHNKKASKGIDRAKEKQILKGKGEYELRKEKFERELKERVEFYISTAVGLQGRGKYDAAKIMIQKGLMLDPENKKLRQLRKENDLSFQESLLSREALSTKNKSERANNLVNKGIKEYLLGNYIRAKRYFEKVLKLDPNDQKAKNSILKIDRKMRLLDLTS